MWSSEYECEGIFFGSPRRKCASERDEMKNSSEINNKQWDIFKQNRLSE